ncbi:glycosyltransferase [Metabacillus litoralis]|uniref:glycosyltransferase n=1 Tax=Metabacillus litoralis TaxID=152268 RepID=UPI001CFC956C|nr:glycosyltransferase family 2 protein [Metabacillus litoralis]
MVAGIIAIIFFLFLCYRIPKINSKYLQPAEVHLASLSIIIPARNEEATLGTLLHSIKSQAEQPLEIIVVDDHSTDKTREIALDFGVKVVDNPPLPQGWLGKSWGCWNGAKHAKGNYLMFVDADTWFVSKGIKRAITFFVNHPYQLLTIHPYHKMERAYEKLSGIFHSIVFISSGVTTLFSNKATIRGGFGQCLMSERDTYFELGGHESIKGEVVENLAFIQRAASYNYKVHAIGGNDVINMRMYQDGVISVFKGWSKSFASGSKMTHPILMVFIVLWISALFSFMANSVSLITEAPYIFILLYSCIAYLFYRMLKDIGNFTFFDAFLFPVHILFFIVVFCFSFFSTFILKNSSWKGRSIHMTKHRDDQEL